MNWDKVKDVELNDKNLVISCVAALAGIAMFLVENPLDVFTHTCAVLGSLAVGAKLR